MFDWLQVNPETLLAILFGAGGTIGGISIFAIIRAIVKEKGFKKFIEKCISEGFAKTVFPTEIRIEATNSMKAYLGTVVPQLKGALQEELVTLKDAMLLTMVILANTAAANKLTDEQKALYQQIYNKLSGTSTDVIV